ncbi:hypothetical protein SADUNF_Sadunf15G0042100 [Salix dunnii]|uniref:Uncharacterized protein n=1 Tax=Salix dunnii TaxID=1413687 RepID=A0A835JI71_9ROSI|nr:hypothetical protein SADUNF_Sadunf15G0042100 [Salix dunnii]
MGVVRRMQEAARYFGKGSGQGWRAAVETEAVELVHDEEDNMIQSSGAGEVAAVEEEENGVLDLNVTPVVESDGA